MIQFLKWSLIVLLLVSAIGLICGALFYSDLQMWIKVLMGLGGVIAGFFVVILWLAWKPDIQGE